jgi:hypothetical protein
VTPAPDFLGGMGDEATAFGIRFTYDEKLRSWGKRTFSSQSLAMALIGNEPFSIPRSGQTQRQLRMGIKRIAVMGSQTMINRRMSAMLLIGLLILSGCDKSEDKVIVNKSPFFNTTLSFQKDNAGNVISAVKYFSEKNGMDYLIAQKSLEPGNFNVSALSENLNLFATHISSLSNGVLISAIAKGDPTPEDKKLTDEFVRQVKAAAG